MNNLINCLINGYNRFILCRIESYNEEDKLMREEF